MSSEIQFGDLEHVQPKPALRPDQDGHFVVAAVGSLNDDELLVYVDLDVMRDMEAHARSNTRVELGGVMLGRQSIDDAGRPFVFVTDCLRASHYEATKGSFKFTHDTWSQITRERKQFRPDLEMVGWYHTHPGWSVFLSGMDLFICNNFFNRPLDVALVIDPCADDRGWFQWTEGPKPVTQRTGGFFLTTGRYRQHELAYFSKLYNKVPALTHDPRYTTGEFATGEFGAGGSRADLAKIGYGEGENGGGNFRGGQMNNRTPIFEFAMIAIVMVQFLFFAVIAWKMLVPQVDDSAGNSGEQVALLQQELSDLKSRQLQQTRDQAWQEILGTIVTAQTGEEGLVENFAKLKTDQQRLQSNLTGQMALVEKRSIERDAAVGEKEKINRELKSLTDKAEDLGNQLVITREKLNEANKALAQSARDVSTESATAPGNLVGWFNISWWWVALGGIGTAILSAALGFSLGRWQQFSGHRFDDGVEQPPHERGNPTVADQTGERTEVSSTM